MVDNIGRSRPKRFGNQKEINRFYGNMVSFDDYEKRQNNLSQNADEKRHNYEIKLLFIICMPFTWYLCLQHICIYI